MVGMKQNPNNIIVSIFAHGFISCSQKSNPPAMVILRWLMTIIQQFLALSAELEICNSNMLIMRHLVNTKACLVRVMTVSGAIAQPAEAHNPHLMMGLF